MRTPLFLALPIVVFLGLIPSNSPGQSNTKPEATPPVAVQRGTSYTEVSYSEPEPEAKSGVMEPEFYLSDIPYLIGLFIILFGPIIFFGWRKWQSASLFDEMDAAELKFESDLLAEFGVTPASLSAQPSLVSQSPPSPSQSAPNVLDPTSSAALPLADQAAPALAPPVAVAPAPVTAATSGSVDARFNNPPSDLDDLASRLVKLTVLADLEGQVPLSHPPNGRIYKLRTGGHALLLPRLETTEFLAHQTRRFDLILALTHTGEVLTISRLQTQLPQLMDRPGDFAKNPGSLLGG